MTPDYVRRVKEAASFVSERLSFRPRLGVILGTGLESLVACIRDQVVIPYEQIPGFPRSTAPGHAGRLVSGSLSGLETMVFQGRFHYYEGYSGREITFPVRLLAELGAELLFIASCAGGLNPRFSPSTLMVVNDHLNFIPDNPLRGENHDAWGVRFPDLSRVYHPGLTSRFLAVADRLGLGPVTSGIYAAVPGPSIETPAETRFLRSIGADAVGMSTAPEVIVAAHAGLELLAVAVIANVNDPDRFEPVTVEKVLEGVAGADQRLARVFEALAGELAAEKSALYLNQSTEKRCRRL